MYAISGQMCIFGKLLSLKMCIESYVHDPQLSQDGIWHSVVTKQMSLVQFNFYLQSSIPILGHDSFGQGTTFTLTLSSAVLGSGVGLGLQ